MALTGLDHRREQLEAPTEASPLRAAPLDYDECTSEGCLRPVYEDALCKMHKDLAAYRDLYADITSSGDPRVGK